jgi:VanZ family protein
MKQANRPQEAPYQVENINGVTVLRSSFKDWGPAMVWMVVLFVLSTSAFSASNTSRVIEPMLRWIFPSASLVTIAMMSNLIRKMAHFTDYAILFWLLFRGPLIKRPYTALACCVIYAFLDEGHQIFAMGRGASLYDVALDSSGALFSRFLNAAIYDP